MQLDSGGLIQDGGGRIPGTAAQLDSPRVFGRQDEESQLFQNSASLALTCLKFRAERL